MRHYDKQHERTDAGYVAVAVAGSLVIFCGMLALAGDAGMLYFQRSHMRAAADSAAMAAAMEVFRGNTSSVTSAAQNDASLNGYTGAAVTVNRPPLSGDHISDSNFVEVIVARDEPTYFMRVLGTTSVHVSARAVAGPGSGSTGDKCLFILSPNAHPALLASGGGDINIPCAIVVNSNDSSSAMNDSGGSCINASAIYVVGTAKTGGCYSPTPISGVPVADDPLAYVTPPTAGSCIATNYVLNGGTASLSPGTYCHTGTNPAILIKGGATVTLAPGTYFLKGGGMSINGNLTHLDGTGVTFYNTCDSGSCASSTTGYGAILFMGGANASISSPTSGSLNNILFFNDRSAPASYTNKFSAGGTFNMVGTLYMKTQEIEFSGGTSTTTLDVNIVSDILTFTGGSNLTITNSFGGGGSAIKHISMVE